MLKRSQFAISVLIATALVFFAYQHIADETIMSAPASDGDRVSFFALGDQGSGRYRQHAVAWLLERECQASRDTHFTLLLGDNFYKRGVGSVNDVLFDEYFESMYEGPCLMGMPFYAMLGNHDYMGNAQAQIDYSIQQRGTGRWVMPDKSYRKGFGKVGDRVLMQLHVIDTVLPLEPQLLEIRNTRKNALWTVVASHNTLRSFDAVYGDDLELLDKMDRFADLGVDLYVSGHAHTLQLIGVKGEPVYLVSGAGGKRPYDLVEEMTDNDLGQRGFMKQRWYARSKLGFAKVSIEAEFLEVAFFPLSIEGSSTFRISYECKERKEIANCIELL